MSLGFFFLRDASKKHKAKSAHNKGALLNTARDTTLYSMTLTAKALILYCWVSGRLVSVRRPKPQTALFDMQNFLGSTTSDFFFN